MPDSIPLAPDKDCQSCPRLVDFRNLHRTNQPSWHNAPVPPFGDNNSPLLIVGMAPGLKGANKTGRPFTGDYAGDLLYSTLKTFGLAKGEYEKTTDDSLELVNCRLTNAVKCVPPQNKLNGAEVKACQIYLRDEIDKMANLKVILALGVLAHGAVLSVLGERKSLYKFGHQAIHHLTNGLVLINSYHCSRYNTNTGRLTEPMFHNVFSDIDQLTGS